MSIKEEFGLTEKPTVEGIIEREANKAVAKDDYSAAELAKQSRPVTKKEKVSTSLVPAYKLTVAGNVRHGQSMEAYKVDIVIQKCPDDEIQYHAQRFVVMELAKQGKLYDGVLTRSIDDIQNTELELTFLGKDVFELSKEEIQYACDYYGIHGCGYTNPSIRAIQKQFYLGYQLMREGKSLERAQQQELISKIDGTLDYTKLPKVTLVA